ncbi:MAG: hypothetical protein EOP04_03605, partial [Proteobacteria bacterium]
PGQTFGFDVRLVSSYANNNDQYYSDAIKIEISSYMGDHLRVVNRAQYDDTPALHPFKIKVMVYERTMIEKTLAVLGCVPHFKDPLSKDKRALGKVERHLYDIHKLHEKFKADGKTMDADLVDLFKKASAQSNDIYSANLRLDVSGLPDLGHYLSEIGVDDFKNAYRDAYASSGLYFTHLDKAQEVRFSEADEILEGVRSYLESLRMPFSQS